MQRYAVLLTICLVAALISYVVGMSYGIAFFIGTGLLFELIFWTALARRDTRSHKTLP